QSGLSAVKLTRHLDKRRDVPPTGEIEVRTAQPAQDLRHVGRLLAEQLAQHKLPAPVHSLSLRSLVTGPLADAAAATTSLLMSERKQGDSAVELIERLSARLGEAQVLAWLPRADHRPEQMQRWVPAQHALKSIAGRARPARARGQNGLKLPVFPGVRSEALYPSWLLPEPLKLAVSGNSPVYQGRLQRLAGPQRLEATGWLAPSEGAYRAHADRQVPPTMRDYYIYFSAQGGLLWIYSVRLALPAAPARPMLAQRHDWYLHGFFA
ncbi:MAG: DNA polymerase Y family protein, partial [Polaromonas sp.]|nr:DNA polymerase Y family protein [Polaromonas sp.]